jgi:acyl-CoA thioesterase FadM
LHHAAHCASKLPKNPPRATVIARADDGGSNMLKPLMRASSRWAFVDLATRKPAAIPDAVRQALVGA